MKQLTSALRRVADDLERAGARFAVVGGLAVSVRTIPRFTRDVDLAVAVQTDREAERIVGDLLSNGYRMLAQLEHLDTKRFATVRLLSPKSAADEGSPPIVDLLFATTGIEPEIVAAAEPLEISEGVIAPVARIAHLVAMKVLSFDANRRPQDGVDLSIMLRDATSEDLALARRSLELINERGCGRTKDLLAAFDEALARADRSG